MLLKVCVNGARRPSEHLALPVTPPALAREVARSVAAGAGAAHLHVKDDEGNDTLDGVTLTRVLAAVREAAPGVPLGVTTGAWAVPDPGARVAAVASWTVLPDFASVNWHEEGAEAVAALLLDRGVDVEAGLWHADAVDAWLSSPLRDRCLRVLLELPDGSPTEVEPLADELLGRVRAGVGDRIPVLLHGEGSSCWPALRHAVQMGLASRIGLEDVLVLPDGTPAPDNAALVSAARLVLRTVSGGG